MQFAKRPFLVLTSLLCMGVLFSEAFDFSSSVIGVGLAIVILLNLTLIGSQWKWLTVVLSFAGVFLLGALSLSLTMVRSSHDESSSNLSYFIQVEEIAEDTKEWRKSVCKVIQVIDSTQIQKSDEEVLVYFNSSSIEQYDNLIVHCDFEAIKNNGNPGEFDSKNYWRNKNINRIGFVSDSDLKLVGHNEPGQLEAFFIDFRNSLKVVLDEHLSGTERNIAHALILGDKSLLTTETRRSFSRAGAMHVLAVSGLHVGIVLYILIFIFQRFPRVFSKSGASIVAIVIVWVYAGVTGFSPSVMRAVFMFSMLAIGQLSGRKVDGLNNLAFSAFALLLINPLLLFDIGFQLSYLAMIGILVMYKPISRMVYSKYWIVQKAWEGTAVGLSAQLFTVPLTLYYFHQFPNYFALSNLGVMMFAGIILGAGIALLAFSWISWMAKFISFVLAVLLSALLFFIQFIEGLPGAVAYGYDLKRETVVLIFAMLILTVLFRSKKIILYSGISILLFSFSFIQYSRYKNMTVNEAVIFNDSNPVIALKMSDRIVCFYSNREKAEYLMGNYMSVRPGIVEYRELVSGNTRVTFSSNEYIVCRKQNSIELIVDERSFCLRTYYGDVGTNHARIIDMPYLEGGKGNYNLKEGSFHIDL